jgi:hypothetical protein
MATAAGPLPLVFVVTRDTEDDEDEDAPWTTPAGRPPPPTTRTEGLRGPIGNGGRERRFGGGAGSIMGALGIMRRDGMGRTVAGDEEVAMCAEAGLMSGENSWGVSGKAAAELVESSRWRSVGYGRSEGP